LCNFIITIGMPMNRLAKLQYICVCVCVCVDEACSKAWMRQVT